MTVESLADPRGRLPRSLYAETAREGIDTQPLRGDVRSEVVVVGGGFTGLSTALHLAQGGKTVTVLEAHEPGWGASGRNGGQVNPGLKHEPDVIETRFGRDLGSRMVSLSGNAPNVVFDLIRNHQIRCEANQSGTIRATFTAGSAEAIRRATAVWQARGAPVELLEHDAIEAATGTTRYLCGAFDRRGGSVNPLGYARGLAEAAIRAGAIIHGQSPATALARTGDGWTVTSVEGQIKADWIVLATNGYTDDLWPNLRRSIVPVYSGIVASDPLPAAIAARILPIRSVLYEHESLTVYYRLDANNRLLIGGRSPLRPLDGPEDFRDLIRYAQRLWPFMSASGWSHGWNGQLALTTDHYPHLHVLAPQLIAALGYNGRGIAMATVMGGELARLVTGTPPSALDMPVTGLRPIPFHRFWPVGATARIAYGRLRNAVSSIRRG